jgi:hypothetical protein
VANTRTYDPGEHLLSFLGIALTAFGPDTFIDAARAEDGFKLTVGAGGEVARSRSRNRTGRVTITLLASSPENDLLMQAVIADEATGEGIGPLFLKDRLGTTVLHAENAWVAKVPDTKRAKEVGVYEWALDCADLEIFAGGNVASGA